MSVMNTTIVIMLLTLGKMLADACPSINGSCCEVKNNQFKFSSILMKSHVYSISGDCELSAEGYCDAVTDGGKWLMLQRRKDGSTNLTETG